jgi:hypothetical protein
MDSLKALRIDLAKRSKWNIGYFAAGFVYWCFAAITGTVLPVESAKIYWMIGGFTIFPMTIILSRFWGADPFTRGNTLGDLIRLTHGSLMGLLLPLVIICFLYLPQALPLAAAICFGASFPVFFWAFGDHIFLSHIIIGVAGAAVLWVALPSGRFSLLPAFVAVMYLVTAILLPGRRAAWLRAHDVAVSTP